MWRQFHLEGVALAAIGACALAAAGRRRTVGAVSIASFIVVLLFTAFYAVEDRHVFYVPAVIVLSMWCGAGLGRLLARAHRLPLGAATLRLAAVAGAAVAVAIPLKMVGSNWGPSDRSRQYEVVENAALRLAGVPRNAVVVLVGDEDFGAAMYYSYVLHPERAPRMLTPPLTRARWYQAQLEPPFPAAVAETAAIGGDLEDLACAIRRHLDRQRPLYTNISNQVAPPGYVCLVDDTLTRMVAPPGIPQARDAQPSRTLLPFPGDTGALLDVTLPSRVTRGEPFTISASVRWTAAAPPQGVLYFIFARSDAARAEGTIAATRSTNLLFLAPVAPNQPGWHYVQSVNALVSRIQPPGPYRVFVQFAQARSATSVVPVGTVSVR